MSNPKERNTKGLLAIWADVDEDYRIEFQRWHNCEHMTERVTIPGFYVGRRYQGVSKAPDFLMMYETYDSKVMSSEPYLFAKNNPTAWTKKGLTHFKNGVRNIYYLVATAGKRPATEAPYILVLRFNLEVESKNEIIKWYSEEHLVELCTVPGVYRGRLYEVDAEVSNIKTTERSISGTGPGQQILLALYEISSLDLSTSKQWQGVLEGTDRSKKMLMKLEDLQEESYWLDFTMYAPEVG